MTQSETSKSDPPAFSGNSSVECTILSNHTIVADLHRAIECLSARDSERHMQAVMHCQNALGSLQAMLYMEGGAKAVRGHHLGRRARSMRACAAGPAAGEGREQWMEALARSMDIALGVKHETSRLSFESI